jgi:hypothetical protein
MWHSTLLFLVGLVASTVIAADSNEEHFLAELQCRKDVKDKQLTMQVYIFCAVPIALALIQLITMIFFVVYVRKVVGFTSIYFITLF